VALAREMVLLRFMTEAGLTQWVTANPGQVNDRDTEGETPLYVAAPLSLVLWLLDDKGADVNILTRGSRIALHGARSPDIFNALLDRGADLTLRDRYGWTTLTLQVYHRNVESVACLLQDPRVRSTVNFHDNEGRTALHAACMYNGCVHSIVRLLLQAGADPAITGNGGLTPLTYLRQYQPSYHTTMTPLEQALADAEKTSLLARSLVIVANAVIAPSYLKGRLARGQILPRIALVLLTTGQSDHDAEEHHLFHRLMTFVLGMGGGPGGGIPRDVFRVVMDLLMPKSDPLRRGVVGMESPVQG